MENYQTPEGVVVPDVLRPYLGGTTIFPYVHKELPTPKVEFNSIWLY
jgi:seryl-tRNA synthetase